MSSEPVAERDDTLCHGDEVWERLSALLDERIDRAVNSDGWTGKDVYAHFARWQAVSIDSLRAILAGRRPVVIEQDEDVLNDRWRAEDERLTADEARSRCASTRTELRDLVAQLDAEQWHTFGKAFEDITGPHAEGHLKAASMAGVQ